MGNSAHQPGQHCAPAWATVRTSLATVCTSLGNSVHQPRQQCAPAWAAVCTSLLLALLLQTSQDVADVYAELQVI
jgi:hypothetical protein